MKRKNGLDMLHQDIGIPEVVNEKAQEAFSRIRRENADVSQEKTTLVRRTGRRKMKKKKVAAAILAAVLVVGTVSVAIAANNVHISASLRAYLGLTDEQEQELIESDDPILDLVEERSSGNQTAENLTAEETGPEADETAEVISATDQGITITVEQTMADNFVIMITYRIEGVEYDPETEYAPHFFGNMTLDGRNPHVSGSGRTMENEDGSVEYIFVYRPKINRGEESFAPGEFLGKEITLSIDTIYIGNAGKDAEGGRTIEGSWNLSWTLHGTDVMRVETLDETLGDTGAVVKEVQISPLSLTVLYEFPAQEMAVTVTDGEGSTYEGHEWADPPTPFGIIMADGTEYTSADHILSGGNIYRNGDHLDETYEMRTFTTIIDPGQVAGILIQDIQGSTGEGDTGTIYRVMFEEE